jgi:hypothetical protein
MAYMFLFWGCCFSLFFICLPVHDLLLADATADFGEEGKSGHGDGDGDFLIARQRHRGDDTARLALYVDEGTTVTFGFDTEATAREETRRAAFAATFKIATTNTGLSSSVQ